MNRPTDNSSSRRISLRDIARKANVSIPTVSLALRDDPRIARETKLRISETAKALGYVANPLLASLATKQFRKPSASIGLAYITGRTPDSLCFKHEYEAVKSVIPTASQRGYNLETFVAKKLASRGDQNSKLRRKGIMGLILSFASRCDELPSLDWDSYALVVVGPPPPNFNVHCVDIDHFECVRMTWRHVRAAGYQRIGIAPLQHNTFVHDDVLRHAAAQTCMSVTEPSNRIPILDTCKMDDVSHFIKWVERYKPDAVIGMHAGQRVWLTNAGYRVPEDIAFACLHVRVPDGGSTIRSNVAGARFMRVEILDTAIQILSDKIRYGKTGFDTLQRKTLLPTFWVDGDSLPPCRQ